MSTLPNISATARPESLPGEPGTPSLPNAAGGIAGLFEQVMAKALSPSNKNVSPNVKSEPVGTPAQPAVNSAQPDSVQFNSKTSSKANEKSASTSSNADDPSTSKATNAVETNLTTSQLIAEANFMINPAAKWAPEIAPVSPPPQIPPAVRTAAASVAQTVKKEIPAAATKISASDLAEDEASASAQASSIQKATQLAANETKLSKAPEISIPIDPTGSSATAKVTVQAENQSSSDSDPNVSAPTAPSDAHGTSAAKQDIAMQQAEKPNKIAGQIEKVLPGSSRFAAQATAPAPFSTNTGQMAATAAANSSMTGVASTAPATQTDSVGVAAMDLPARTLERTQDMVTVNATRFSDSGNSSMQVVIKPDAGTQLSLELRQHGGNVQVQATLQQGNFGHLNQQWPDLQQRLEQRGIKLAPLSDEAPFANNTGGETFQNKQNQTAPELPEVTLVDAPVGMFSSEAAHASARSGWENWA
jgi:hypothetical protein